MKWSAYGNDNLLYDTVVRRCERNFQIVHMSFEDIQVPEEHNEEIKENNQD